MATYRCGNCGYSQPTSDALVGKKVKCPKCNAAGAVSASTPLEAAAQQMQRAKTKAVRPRQLQQVETPPPSIIPPEPSSSATWGSGSGYGSNPATMKACPFCGEWILMSAKKCKHCGEFLDKKSRPRQQQSQAAYPGHTPTYYRSSTHIDEGTTDVCAILTFVFALLSWFLLPILFAPATIVMAWISYYRTKEKGYRGRMWSILGGLIGILPWCFLLEAFGVNTPVHSLYESIYGNVDSGTVWFFWMSE